MQPAVVQRGCHSHVCECPDRTRGDKADPAPEDLVRFLQPSIAVGEEVVQPEIEGHGPEGCDGLAPAEIGPRNEHERIEDRHVDEDAQGPDGPEQCKARRDQAAEALVVETGKKIE